MPTLAEHFISDRNAMIFESPYNGTQTYMHDTDTEVEFEDGSFVHCVDYVWNLGKFPEDRKVEQL